MVRDRDTDKFKGIGFVEFGSKTDLENALSMTGTVSILFFFGKFVFIPSQLQQLNGRSVRIDVANSRQRGGRDGTKHTASYTTLCFYVFKSILLLVLP